ncbi:MAG TPA: TlpA disulfide reductase family protein [Catenuloplanes sp.]|jgi:thiol-disulfide isomerase/thioredoxin
MARGLRAVAAAALVAGALAGCGGPDWQQRCPADANAVLHCPADDRPPPVALGGELLDGRAYDLTADRGKVVVVNFWGSWCAPCRAEAEDLEQTYRATRDAGVAFLGVNSRDDRDKAKAFEQGQLSYPSLFDPGERVGLKFAVPPSGIPTTIILDRAGRIAVAIRRSTTLDELRPLVQRVAAESPPPAGTR